MSMKFVKGMVIGGLISAGVAMMCSETMQPSRRKMVKMGKQFTKKMGIMQSKEIYKIYAAVNHSCILNKIVF